MLRTAKCLLWLGFRPEERDSEGSGFRFRHSVVASVLRWGRNDCGETLGRVSPGSSANRGFFILGNILQKTKMKRKISEDAFLQQVQAKGQRYTQLVLLKCPANAVFEEFWQKVSESFVIPAPTSLKIADPYVVVKFPRPRYLSALTKQAGPETEIYATTERKLRAHSMQWFELLGEHALPAPPSQKDMHVVIWKQGAYLQRPVVEHVFSILLSDMKSSSEVRGHAFNLPDVKVKMLDAFDRMDPDFRCACPSRACQANRVTMTFYGVNGISPDREFDPLSYVAKEQVLTFVAKSHNISVKATSQPRKRVIQTSWLVRLAQDMLSSTAKRIAQLRKKAKHMTQSEKEQVTRFDSELKTPRDEQYSQLKKVLVQKQVQQDGKCAKCRHALYVGDANGVLRECNRGDTVSPDRIDNTNIFYDAKNFQLVCVSCNYSENQGGRTYIENKVHNADIPFTPELLEQCRLYLSVSREDDM
jgi:hypothetical protein